ncbi:MAG: fibronectin type III domain-containing protein, partial [Elusimicrobiota bacterium]
TSYAFTGLNVNALYYGYVSTSPGAGFMLTASGVTQAAAPPAAEFLTVAYSSAALTWEAGINPPWTLYQYEAADPAAPEVILSSGMGAGTTGWLTGLTEGTTYYGRVRAVNDAGVPSAYTYTPGTTLPLVVDKPPTAAIFRPQSGSFVNSLAQVSGVAADDVALSSVALLISRLSDNYYWNSSAWTPDRTWLTAGLDGSSWVYSGVPAWVSNSSYTLIAKAIDSAGNWSLAYSTSVFTYDTAPPVLLIAAPGDGSFLNSGSTAAVVSYSDAGGSGPDASTLVIKLDSVALSTAAFTLYASSAAVQLAGLTQGAHTLDAAIYDKAGNPAAAAQTGFLVDLSSPVISIVRPANGSVFVLEFSTTAIINYSDAGGAGLDLESLVVKWDGVEVASGAVTVYASSAAVVLADLRETFYTLNASIRDKAGNLANAAQSNFSVDSSFPPAAVTDLAAAPASSGAITLSWTAPGADGMGGVLDESTFTIQYSTFTGVEWSSMAVSAARITISTSGVNPGSGQSYTVGGLSVNTSYYFRLWTQDDRGNWSAISNGPAAATFAAAPSSAGFSGVFYSSAALSWQAAANPAW